MCVQAVKSTARTEQELAGALEHFLHNVCAPRVSTVHQAHQPEYQARHLVCQVPEVEVKQEQRESVRCGKERTRSCLQED